MDLKNSVQYTDRVLVGNWYEKMLLEEALTLTYSATMDIKKIAGWKLIPGVYVCSLSTKAYKYKTDEFLKQMKSGQLQLAKYRKLTENLNTPAELSQDPSFVRFGAKVTLLAPYAPATHPPVEGKVGLLLGGRLDSNEIRYHQDLTDGSVLVGIRDLTPMKRTVFTVTSSDYCDRQNEILKNNQEFMLTLTSSLMPDKVPLYLRYDPDPIPGLTGIKQLYLSKHPVANTRWRVLPIQEPNITRFEREGDNVPVNTDVVINHCSTNINLGVNVGVWRVDFHGRVCSLLMKTCLDIYKNELPQNIWRFYLPLEADKK